MEKRLTYYDKELGSYLFNEYGKRLTILPFVDIIGKLEDKVNSFKNYERVTYKNKEFNGYRLKTKSEPWNLEYWDLVNIIGNLEDKIEINY